MSSRGDTSRDLKRLAEEAFGDIAQAVQEVATSFVAAGGYGTLQMFKASNEKIVETFRFAIGRIAHQAIQCHSPSVARQLVEGHLSQLIDQTIEQRAEHLRAGNIASEETELLCSHLRRDLKRLKDATVRGLAIN
jgi:uncharacterized protein HemY